ncbi:MAG: hypothetical protein V1763_02825, partial [Parcubacteria group bacterium]
LVGLSDYDKDLPINTLLLFAARTERHNLISAIAFFQTQLHVNSLRDLTTRNAALLHQISRHLNGVDHLEQVKKMLDALGLAFDMTPREWDSILGESQADIR